MGLPLTAQAQLFGGKKVPDAVVVNGSAPLPAAGELFTSNGSASKPSKVVMGSFTVEFSTMHGMKASQSSGLGSSANQTLELFLTGVEPAQMQAITDAAYDAFFNALRGAGVEVVTKDELVALAAYKVGAAAGKPSGTVKESGGLKLVSYAPSGMVINGLGLAPGASDYAVNNSLGTLGALVTAAQVIGSTTEAVSSTSQLLGVSEALGGARLLQVRLALYFAELNGEFGRMPSTLSAGVKSKVGLYLDPRNTSVVLMHEDGKGSRTLTLKQALLVDGAPFTGSEDISPTGANVATALFSAAIGGNTSSRTSRFNLKADPAQFSSLATAGLVKAAPLVATALLQ